MGFQEARESQDAIGTSNNEWEQSAPDYDTEPPPYEGYDEMQPEYTNNHQDWAQDQTTWHEEVQDTHNIQVEKKSP
jgi:hypothetical protein